MKFVRQCLSALARYGWPLGCLLVAFIFIWSGWGKLMNPQGTATAMTAVGIPLSAVLVYMAIVIELGGGAALAIGFKRAIAALLLSLFLVAATLSFHAFWRESGPEQQGQLVQFAKNMAILGGLLCVAFTRSGWRHKQIAVFAGRLLLALIFFLNAFGIVSQERSTHELILAGVPQGLAPWFIRAGQVTQAVAGVLLLAPNALTVVAGALVLAGFLVPATLIAHNFWMAPADLYTAQLVNFLKNLAAIGSLLVVAATYAREGIKSGSGTSSGTESTPHG